MRECCYLKRIDLEILTDLYIVRTPLPPNAKKRFFNSSACISICAPRWRLDGSTDFALIPNLSVIGRCPVNMNILASKIEDALHMIPKTKWRSS